MPTFWIRDIIEDADRGQEQPKADEALVVSPWRRGLSTSDGEYDAAASLDLRLGCYFIVFNRTDLPALIPGSGREEDAAKYQMKVYVPLGTSLCLQPGEFVLGATLEWIRIPLNRSAYVIGKSSVGRTGLVIETAGMIHPAFTGCLTLEISNLSSVPVHIFPGMDICQIVLHTSSYGSRIAHARDSMKLAGSAHVGARSPRLGGIIHNKAIRGICDKAKEIYSEPIHTVGGLVLDPHGDGLPNVEVQIGGDHTAWETTDGQGRWETGLRNGRYSATPSSGATKYEPQCHHFDVENRDYEVPSFVATQQP